MAHIRQNKGDDMATILDLLMALNRDELPPVPAPASPVPLAPAPTGNVPEYGGPSMVTEPPQAPLDTRLIQQMLALRGPAPTPPAPRSKAERIFNALAGFGAGFQGNGPQFLQQLREPQQQYQRQLQRYNNLGTELGTQGLTIAQRQQEQKTRRAQEVSDREFEAEVRRETRRLNLTDQREIEMFRDTLATRRAREKAERDEAAAERKRREQQEDDARTLAGRLGTGAGAAPPALAKELGRYYANLTDNLSPAAAKWVNAQAEKAQILARKAATVGGRTSKDAKLVDEFENLKRQLYPARERGDTTAENGIMRRIEAIGSMLQAKGFEVGYGENPYQKPPQAGQQQAAPAVQTFSRAQVQAYARKTKRSPADVEADLKARGFNVQ